MKPITIAKISVDCAMTLLLLSLMAFHITGEAAHMALGAVMGALVIAHLVLNRGWIRTIHKGRYNALRLFRFIINLLIFLCFSGLMVSGIMMSPARRVFQFLPLMSNIGIARTAHHVLAYWGFILTSMHIGMYVNRFQNIAVRIFAPQKPGFSGVPPLTRPLRAPTIPCAPRVFAVLVVIYGVYAFINREIYSYMFLLNEYTFFDYEQPAYLFFIDYLSIMGLFIIIAHYASTLVLKRFRSKA
jgi:hypothetical protein